VNKIDLIDEDERQRILDHIKDKIATSVLDETARVYGADSPRYRSATENIGSIKLIPVSAKRALNGKMKNSPDMVWESGYKEFEEALSYLLTEERGLLDLLPELKKAYGDVSDDVEGFIAAYPLDSLDFKNKSAMEEFTEKISGEINSVLSSIKERFSALGDSAAAV